MTVYHEQISQEERERILALVEKGEVTIHKAASLLDTPYTTIISRVYRGSTIKEALTKPIQKRVYSHINTGNDAWKALGDEARG